MAVATRDGSRQLQVLNSEERRKILLAMADALEKNESMIRLENEADVADAEAAGYEKSLISRLTLKPEKISSFVKFVRMLADMDEPVGQILKRTEVKTLFIFLEGGFLILQTLCNHLLCLTEFILFSKK